MPKKSKPRSAVPKPAVRRQVAKPSITDEVVNLLTTLPSHEKILKFHPSAKIQRRASELLHKNREGTLTDEDRDELKEFSQIESFIRLLKAKVRTAKTRDAQLAVKKRTRSGTS